MLRWGEAKKMLETTDLDDMYIKSKKSFVSFYPSADVEQR